MSTCRKLCLGWIAGCLMTLGSPLFVAAQVIIIQPPAGVVPPVNPPVTPPSARLIPPRPTPLYTVKQVEFAGTIRDQAASLQLTQVFQNTGSGTLEAQLLFPMADAAAISGLTLIVDGKELTGKLLRPGAARICRPGAVPDECLPDPSGGRAARRDPLFATAEAGQWLG